jgi:hypothetical protein
MQQKVQRPDTPLAPTPEPMPVSSGMQMPASKPITKYQAVADAAISQIKNMSAQTMPQTQPQQEPNQQ